MVRADVNKRIEDSKVSRLTCQAFFCGWREKAVETLSVLAGNRMPGNASSEEQKLTNHDLGKHNSQRTKVVVILVVRGSRARFCERQIDCIRALGRLSAA